MQWTISASSAIHGSTVARWGGLPILAALLSAFLPSLPVHADTLDKVRAAGKLVLGYRTDARPFSYEEQAGTPTGYSITLCQKIADEIKAELGLPQLTVEWSPVTLEERHAAIQQGKIDLLCGADTADLSRRKLVSFSIPIYPGGIGALVRSDAPPALREVLSGQPASGPIWRGSPARILERKTISVVKGTTGEQWLADRMAKLQIPATVIPAASYEEGIGYLRDQRADVFFGEREILLEDAAADLSAGNVLAIERRFTTEPIALTLARNNDDLRLIVDRTLSKLFTSDEFHDLYVKWFGEPDQDTLSFYQQSAIPE